MDVQKIINIISSLSGGNNKVTEAAKEAIKESSNYAPTIQGAMQIAQRFGFNAMAIQNMKQHLNNPIVQMGLNAIAPNSINKIKEMSNQLEQSLSSTPSTSKKDDLSERLAKFGIH